MYTCLQQQCPGLGISEEGCLPTMDVMSVLYWSLKLSDPNKGGMCQETSSP